MFYHGVEYKSMYFYTMDQLSLKVVVDLKKNIKINQSLAY